MIEGVTKYADVRAAAERPVDAHRGGAEQGRRLSLSKRLDGRAPGGGTRPTMGRRGPAILVPPKGMVVRWDEWMWKELREGGYLQRYFAREKGMSGRRQRAIGRRMAGFKHARTEDLELKACVPAREFFRWKQVDKDFWADDGNLRSLKRDNPELCIYNVGQRRTAGRKVYAASAGAQGGGE